MPYIECREDKENESYRIRCIETYSHHFAIDREIKTEIENVLSQSVHLLERVFQDKNNICLENQIIFCGQYNNREYSINVVIEFVGYR